MKRLGKQRSFFNGKGWRLSPLLLILTVVSVALSISSKQPTTTQAAPFGGCDTNGYLYKYPGGPTNVHTVDMVTGQDTVVPPDITGRHINAIGYNVKDNFIYGWDDQNDVFVRVHSDHTVDVLTINGYTGPTTGIVVGDVDENGHYWQLVGNTWYQIDLTTTPNPTQINTVTPPLPHPAGSGGADWAFIPGTNAFWRIMDDAGAGRLWSFDRTTQVWTNHTPVTPIAGISGGDLLMGAFYADPNGFLYGSSNSTGNLWRVNVNSTPFTAEQVGTGNPSSSNDGARCALAPVPIDFGDAPSSYSTTLGEDGPRHSIIGFNDFNSSAPLMLGKKVDIENDGFPGANATGDDANHTGPDGYVDDERGVTHIVVTPTTSTPLTVPVYVVNASSSPATLAGWVDLDNDGIFETGERVMVAVSANFNGYKELTFPAPPSPYTVNTFSRFRIFSGTIADPQPTSAASGGEVEDVLVQVGTYDVSKTANPAEDGSVGSGQIVTYTLTIKNTGLTALTNLKIDDNLADVLDDATLQGNPIINPTSAGSASVSDNVLEFVGDVGIGQTVTVTYAVKVKDAGSLGNAALHNTVLAAHSTNCHHEVDDDGSATTDHPDCNTSHTILGLANTGGNFFVPMLVAVGLLGSSGAALYYMRRHSRTIPHTTGQK